MRGARLFAACAAAIIGAFVTAGCGPEIDLKTALQITDVTAGWHDAGIVEGKNKITPSITFRLRKTTDRSIDPLALNIAFKRLAPPPAGQPASVATEEAWDEVYIASVTFKGNETDPLTVVSSTGYTGDPPQSRADMLRHSQFRDMRARIFARHGSAQWAELGNYDIPRQLLAR
jgi:hypothetical protein